MQQKMFLIGGLLAAFFVALAWLLNHAPHPAYDHHQRDLVVRTLWAEAGKEPRQGQLAVLWVMRNRVGCYGWDSLTKVVKAKNQFEPWVWDKTRARMQAFSDNHKLYADWQQQDGIGRRRVSIPFAHIRKVRADYRAYQKLSALHDHVMNAAQKYDPTGGAFYFENRSITKKRGRKSLCHGRKVTVIGHHSFCQAEKIVKQQKCKRKNNGN